MTPPFTPPSAPLPARPHHAGASSSRRQLRKRFCVVRTPSVVMNSQLKAVKNMIKGRPLVMPVEPLPLYRLFGAGEPCRPHDPATVWGSSSCRSSEIRHRSDLGAASSRAAVGKVREPFMYFAGMQQLCSIKFPSSYPLLGPTSRHWACPE